MTLNANAKAFVPGGGSGTPSAAPTPAAPPVPPEPPLFRYQLHLPSTRSIDIVTVPSSFTNLALLLARRSLVSGPKGGPGIQAGQSFYQEFFEGLRLPLPEVTATPLNANGLYVPSAVKGGAAHNSNVGFFFSRDLLNHAADVLTEANDRDGFLIPLPEVPPHGTHLVVASLVLSAWNVLFHNLYSDTRVSGLGYILVETPRTCADSPVAYQHYFFVTKAPQKASNGVPLTADMFSNVVKTGVLTLKHVLPYVLSNNAPLAGVLHFTDAVMPAPLEAVGPVFHVAYDPNSARLTIPSIALFQQQLQQYVTGFEWGKGKAVTEVVQVVVHVSASSNTKGELAMPTVAFVQAVESTFRALIGTVLAASIAPSFLESAVGAALDLETLLEEPCFMVEESEEVALRELQQRAHGTTAKSILRLEAVSAHMSTALHGIVSSTQLVSDYTVVLHEMNECFQDNTNGSTSAAAASGDKKGKDAAAAPPTFSFAACAGNRSVTAANLLTRATFAKNINKLAKEELYVRRRLCGTPVLVVVDSTGRVYCVGLEKHEVVGMIHADIWSCLHWGHYASMGVAGVPTNCVLEATLVSTYRGDRQYRLVVHDVLRWNGINVMHRPFMQRFACVEPLELETNWAHFSIHHVVLLRAQYAPLAQAENAFLVGGAANGASLVTTAASNVDHPFLGFEVISTGPDVPQRYVFVPQDAITVRFQSGMIEKLDETTRRAHLMAEKDPAPVVVEAPAGPQPGCAAIDGQPTGSSADAQASEEEGIEVEEEEKVDFYNNEYVDFYLADVEGDVGPGWVLECALLRHAATMAHHWDVVRAFPPGTSAVTPISYIDAVIASPMISPEEWRWLQTVSNYVCVKCGNVEDHGKPSNTANNGARSFVCRPCWAADGYGDCLYCNKVYVHGGKDTITNRFYCEVCWGLFQTSRTFAVGAPPPPKDATFSVQVSTRVCSLLIDAVCSGKGATNDVLDLCAGGGVVRKWASAQVQRYLGIDNNTQVVEELKSSVSIHKPAGSQFDVQLADCFAPATWTNLLPQIHPQQFHVITCFHGLHQCFDTESHARDAFYRISNALVPNGVFLTQVVGANALFQRGREITTPAFQCSWGVDAGPRLGASYRLTVTGDPEKTKNVVPLDILVAIAADYHLQLVEEHCSSFMDILTKDAKWQRPTSQEEKEYLALRLTVVFRKAANRETVASSPSATSS